MPNTSLIAYFLTNQHLMLPRPSSPIIFLVDSLLSIKRYRHVDTPGWCTMSSCYFDYNNIVLYDTLSIYHPSVVLCGSIHEPNWSPYLPRRKHLGDSFELLAGLYVALVLQEAGTLSHYTRRYHQSLFCWCNVIEN